MVGSGGTRADAGGQLLRELEALSAALYNATAGGGSVRERRTTSGGGGGGRRSLDDLGAAAVASRSHQGLLTWHSQGLEPKNKSSEEEDAAGLKARKKKAGSLWDWKPLRALAHIGQRRFCCSFSAHVHGVKQLPPSIEGLRLEVRLRHKDEERRTVPSLVFRGTADIEETLRLRCSVYASMSSLSAMRYMSKTFVLSVVAPEAGDLELGKHRLDLTRILPREHDGSGLPVSGSNSSWDTSFKLSGKVKGALLAVTFGYEIESSTAAGEAGDKVLCPPSPDPGFEQLRSFNSLPNSPELGDSKRPMISPARSQGAEFLASEYSIDIDQLNFGDDGEEENQGKDKEEVSNGGSSALLAPGTPGRHDELKEFSLEQSSGKAEEEEEAGEFSVTDQGFEDGCNDNSSLKLWGVDEKDASLDEEAEQEIGEFLHMLGPNSDSDEAGAVSEGLSDSSPRALLLKQFEQEQAMVMGGFQLSIGSDQEVDRPSHESSGAGGIWCSSDDEQDLSAFLDAAESELQKATQLMKSKARAKMLEDAEAEALMQEWGLNEKAFQNSPPKSEWLGDASTALVVLPPTPCLAEGFGTTIATRDGGSLRSMNPVHFQGARNEGGLVMHVSKSVVVPTEMGSDVLDIFRTLAAGGAENMTVQVMETMPLDDITGKTVQQIALEGQDAKSRYSLEAGKHKSRELEHGHHGSGPLARTSRGDMSSAGSSSLLSPTKYATPDDALMSLDELAPVAMEKIEALAMQGLKIQSDMSEEEAPYAVEPLWRENRRSKKTIGVGSGSTGVQLLESSSDSGSDDLMSMSISLDEWMRLDAGVLEDAETDDKTRAVMAAHNAAHTTTDIVLMATNGDEEQDKEAKQRSEGLMGDSVTLAMLVQLRDPLRNYEPVGAPMIALVQAERVMLPPQKPRMWKRVSLQGNGEKDEEEEQQEAKPQFKITGVHLAGLKPGESSGSSSSSGKPRLWGTQKQQQSGSRWLLAHGMGKPSSGSSKHPLLKSRASAAPAASSAPAAAPAATTSGAPVKNTSNKLGESLWSISSRSSTSGSKSSSKSSVPSTTRNPDVKLGSRLSFGKKKW